MADDAAATAAAATGGDQVGAGGADVPIVVDEPAEQEPKEEQEQEPKQEVILPVELLEDEEEEKADDENAGDGSEVKQDPEDASDDEVVLLDDEENQEEAEMKEMAGEEDTELKLDPEDAGDDEVELLDDEQSEGDAGDVSEPKQELGDADDDDDVVVVDGPEAVAESPTCALESEFQCVLCHDVLFKPTSVFCGHSFCRVCLMKTFLSRPIDEAQCPTCRADLLRPLAPSASPSAVFSVNVTLWNAVQLLLPTSIRCRRRQRRREAQSEPDSERATGDSDLEEDEYASLLDQVDAKWRIHFLQHQATAFHDRRAVQSDGDNSEDVEEDDEDGSQTRQRRLYPEISVESTVDGRLSLSRNVVLDTTDANEDGHASMRLALAIVDFPSIVELYSEHQECEVAVIKLEEDEAIVDGGPPFFLDEHGNDDELVLPNYFNEVTLRVRDQAGNCVLERTRGAQRGTVRFPSLRLDVPGGEYTFTFTDDLYGLKLSVTTTLREPHESSDAPLPEYISLVNDEVLDGSRRGRRRRQPSEEEEDDGEQSDDSFIVNDEDEDQAIAATAAFSDEDDDDHGEGVWQYSSDDEARDEERERRRVDKRRRQEEEGGADRIAELVDESDGDGEQQPVRRRNASQIVDSDDEQHEEEEEEEDGDVVGQESEDEHQDGDEDDEEDDRPAKRARLGRPIVDESDQEEEVGDEEEEQFERAHPCLDEELDEQRNLYDAIQDEEEEDEEDERAFGVEDDGDEDDGYGRDPDDFAGDGMDLGDEGDVEDEVEFY